LTQIWSERSEQVFWLARSCSCLCFVVYIPGLFGVSLGRF
jgi:hypothetical protein